MNPGSKLKVMMGEPELSGKLGKGPRKKIQSREPNGNVNQNQYVNTLFQKFHALVPKFITETEQALHIPRRQSQSPDLNYIRHLWWAFERQMSDEKTSTNNIGDLEVVMRQE
ncbi:hypothetical protein PHYBLDRAFT_144728 [Phycomyces blakesleeanus NRRL 1555(-)]|uniref:Uncharacterized protein n=1 Tax=Phycomyces blakesleeanus (strain ATCC 8743b / DSM 1359 / FGSC 10004 / NBRC 33097 / NRRL 1555) TaxID=763407 RepID=A0A163DYY5_PHYB8|nr:hypothetical protein PHYBLDRAFT_144728 [Phycomyces blakesleeanus NRRL 1555(-)]OAD74280.1 hypothetical protein PHYBLDRAFT_144728 [Phycomyces blakesleeanus NRRL 1555(-)]|eukprot:XP_018292320.1 hypothetical protein PHYBLDRAFT_144728 [Phycomyces blakesleeanus NRRL 1555(-)]